MYFQDFQGSKLLNGCFVVWPNKQILSVIRLFFSMFNWHIITLVKGQSSFYKIRGLAIYISVKVFNWVDRKLLNILQAFLRIVQNTCSEERLGTGAFLLSLILSSLNWLNHNLLTQIIKKLKSKLLTKITIQSNFFKTCFIKKKLIDINVCWRLNFTVKSS